MAVNPAALLRPARPLLALGALLPLLTACPGPDPDEEPEWEIGLRTEVSEGAFLSAWGPSSDEIYAVGGQFEAGYMARFDGTEWATEPGPEGLPLYNWVYGTGDLLWIAANDGWTARRGADGTWSTDNLGIEDDLWGIWGSGDDDVWTVGGDFPNGVPTLAHWDGSAWTLQELPEIDREFGALLKVWGTGADDVFSVGDNGVILHFDGSTWVQQPSGVTRDLISLWGAGPDEIVSVGGRQNGVIARYDGSTWTSEIIGELPGINGVWMAEDGTAFAAANDGIVLEIEAGTLNWEKLDQSAFPDVLHGAFGLPDGTRVAVGGSLLSGAPWTGVIAQYLP
ncbi:hypothetical protein PPSIR1_02056 [Plesiocystis pacifica SIR-1]|uniref:Photosynthesis system II assembly factor Ycf48/Hcf136-like domain-containing protein n=1 Tax=Plesiocystis pacifica SIR-1 TaxID=391625 RepID=A6GIN2_9BACT|nr:hypothetical protein PPSIR1_02056 [Plesiocystis pacifica SIR-1]